MQRVHCRRVSGTSGPLSSWCELGEEPRTDLRHRPGVPSEEHFSAQTSQLAALPPASGAQPELGFLQDNPGARTFQGLRGGCILKSRGAVAGWCLLGRAGGSSWSPSFYFPFFPSPITERDTREFWQPTPIPQSGIPTGAQEGLKELNHVHLQDPWGETRSYPTLRCFHECERQTPECTLEYIVSLEWQGKWWSSGWV